jgi:hypothetical protein
VVPSWAVNCVKMVNSFIWLGKISVNTTKNGFTVKSVTHRLNFIVYRYMFWSSMDHHQAVFHIDMVTS